MHSASFCRTQEARHRDIAREAPLQNTRDIATVAADAWAKESREADKREARHQRRLHPADLAIAQEVRPETQ